jgi:hypothetical protein
MLEGMEKPEIQLHERSPFDCSAKCCKYTSNPSWHDLGDKVGADVVGCEVGEVGADVVGSAVGIAVGKSVGIAVGKAVGSAVGIGEGAPVGNAVGGDVVGAPVTPSLYAPSAEVDVLPNATAQLTPTITATPQRATNTFRVKMLL